PNLVAAPEVSGAAACTPVQLSQQLSCTSPIKINNFIRGGCRATVVAMRPLAIMLFIAVPLLSAGQAFLREAAEANVNQRYTIESVSVAGTDVERAGIPASLRKQLGALVGARCDMARLEELAGQLRKELRLQAATQRLSRGSQPDRIRVNFEVVRRDSTFELSVPKFLYHSSQGWTGELDATAKLGANSFRVGAVSNGDDLTERFAGFSARFENRQLSQGRVHLGLGFENFEDHWNQSSRAALRDEPGLDLYRSRRNLAPEATVEVTKDVSISGGLSFQSMASENPATGTRAANAVTASAHWGHRTEGAVRQLLDLRYSFRAGLRALGSDYAYSRHAVTMRYEVKSGRHTASDEFQAGTISGDAPLFERFILGSSSTLRGWNRYAVEPLGGSRQAHNTLAWGYQIGDGNVEAFYDSGALWSPSTNANAKVRHSLGAAYRQGIFVLTVAFPVVEGRVSPVFMAGMNY
ncbi:MAG TPA: BamA/TamA family outer membrane protein, partial [Bryobacteraceae bacterium]|nr:BamA/TamA family outer membrane protein [Bryobacteraceae bacterium]